MLQWASLSLEGFRLIGRRTYSFYAWCLLVFAGILAIVGVGILVGPRTGLLSRDAGQMTAGYFMTVVVLGIGSMLTCAVYRAVLGRDEPGIAGLSFGKAELRMMLVTFVKALVGALVLAAAYFTRLWSPLVILAAVVAWSRVSLIGPAVFARGDLDFGAGWRLGKGRYRSLLAMYLATWFATFLCFGAMSVVWRIYGRLVLKTYSYPEPRFVAGLAAGFAPVIIALTAIFVIMVAPAAAAYRALATEEEDVEAERTFG